jgi:hypothetical protein
MSPLDPSYLRSIRDGIISSNIEANNNEALPDGLVGLYDKELFPPSMKWKERKETLDFFLVFALAQKEISADFAAEILGDAWFNLQNEKDSKQDRRLQKVNGLIQLHSKRFSSAGGGKYRLYHERFRVYVLQKVSEKEIAQFNHKFIELCKTALNLNSEKDIPEKESYALEYITTHFYISAMQGVKECLNKEHATALKKYAYDQQFWERQIKASKGFEWSKKMLDQMMQWASKFDQEEVIECALYKVDLYHQEQNDAPRIIQLVSDGDVDTALERIEKFGGDDKDGLQRKFILYMLCLMELTLLDSKNKDHAKSSIEKILKHLDEQLPVDHSVLNWGEFFPGYLMFQMICAWVELEIDYSILFKRTLTMDYSWIQEMSPFSDQHLESILNIIKTLKSHNSKAFYTNRDLRNLSEFIKTISTTSAKSGYIERVIEFCRLEEDPDERNLIFDYVFDVLIGLNKIKDALQIMACFDGEDKTYYEWLSKIKLTSLKHVQSEFIAPEKLLSEVTEEIRTWPNDQNKINLLIKTSHGFHILSEFERSEVLMDEAMHAARSVKNNSKLLFQISQELFSQGSTERADQLMTQLLEHAKNTNDIFQLRRVSQEYAKQGWFEVALNIVRDLDPSDQEYGYCDLISALDLPRMKENLLAIERELPGNHLAMHSFTLELIKCGLFEQAAGYIDKIDSYWYQIHVCNELLDHYRSVNDKQKILLFKRKMQTAFNSISHGQERTLTASALAYQHFLDHKYRKAIELDQKVLLNLSSLNGNQEQFDILLIALEEKSGIMEKSVILKDLVHIYFSINSDTSMIENLADSIDNILIQTEILVELYARYQGVPLLEKIKDNLSKLKLNPRGGSMKLPVAYAMIRLGLFNEALNIEFEENDGYNSKESIKNLICEELLKMSEFAFMQNDKLKAWELLREAIEMADKIPTVPEFLAIYKIEALSEISTLCSKQGKAAEGESLMQEAMQIAKSENIHLGLVCVSRDLAKQSRITEALEIARGIRYAGSKISALLAVAEQMAVNNEPSEWDKLVREALDVGEKIEEDWRRDLKIKEILVQFVKQGKAAEASRIIDRIWKNQIPEYLIEEISLEFIKNNDLVNADFAMNRIPRIASRYSCCVEIGKTLVGKVGYLKATELCEQFPTVEFRSHISSGMFTALYVSNINDEITMNVVRDKYGEIPSFQHVLLMYSLNQLFFSNLPQEKLDRYNRTLNLQWAIDIKNQLPN